MVYVFLLSSLNAIKLLSVERVGMLDSGEPPVRPWAKTVNWSGGGCPPMRILRSIYLRYGYGVRSTYDMDRAE